MALEIALIFFSLKRLTPFLVIQLKPMLEF